MPELKTLLVKDLSLDLNNFRTRPQKNEIDAVKAMINVKSQRFLAILGSILESGYTPTENIIILKNSTDKLIVREGNRRVASIKIILGILKLPNGLLPANLNDKILNATPAFKKSLASVPCLLFESSEAEAVDDIVSLTHGKGEVASRDKWTSVATARHNRDAKGKPEPALDILEQFLNDSDLITGIQRESWSGDYNLTVLHELIRLLSNELTLAKVSDVAGMYVNGELSPHFDNLIFEIGQGALGFNDLRDADGWNIILKKLGIKTKEDQNNNSTAATGSTSSGTSGSNGTTTKAAAKKSAAGRATARKTVAVDDPRYIPSMLRRLVIYGDGREKIVSLKEEATKLNVDKHAFSFCFILRSILELSARAYCEDNGISLKETPKGTTKKIDKKLITLLNDAKKDIISKSDDSTAMKKLLHGAYAELSSNSFLSVMSLNQLIHSATLMTSPNHIAPIFANIFPLLQQLNAPKQ